MVAEGISAAIMLMKCSERAPVSKDIVTKMWNSMETVFTSPKFFTACQDTELTMLISLGKYVFSNPNYQMSESLLK